MQLGIDFGTWNSSAICIDSEQLASIKDSNASPSIPSSVFVTAKGEVFVGISAEHRRRSAPSNYMRELKREIGKNIPIPLGNGLFHVEDLIAKIIGKIREDANKYKATISEEAFNKVVLTIPATYMEHKRAIMQKVAQLSGFTDEEVVFLTEPEAAALYYAWQRKKQIHDGDILLVYDLGGGTFDTALLQRQGEQFIYLNSALPTGEICGGSDFDRFIYHDLIKRYSEIQELVRKDRTDDLSLLTRVMIEELCVDIKHQLSEAEEVTQPVIVPGMGRYIAHTLTRDAFNQMIESTLRKTISCCKSMIDSANITYKQISRILLVGGSCRIPYVRSLLEQEFKCPVNDTSDLELVVCQGAAIYAAMLAKSAPSPLPTDSPIAKAEKPTAKKDEAPPDESSAKTPRKRLPKYEPSKNPWD